MLKLGSLNLEVPFFQAPLSGYTDFAMRTLARRFGAPLTFTGVLLDKIALHPAAVRKLGLAPDNDEHPVGAQILGADPVKMSQAAANFENMGFDIIDLNFACPAPKVLRRGRGGALMTEPQTVTEIYKTVRDKVKCPVTVKLRTGRGSGSENREKFWQICENLTDCGIDAMTIHGRTVLQRYRDTADWNILAQVKKKYPDTVIVGSGDMFVAEDIVKKVKDAGIDGALIARGAVGNPWLFADLCALYKGQPRPEPPGMDKQAEVILSHYDMIAKRLAGIKGIRYFRKFAAGYCKRHPERKKAQLALMAVKNREQICDALKKWFLEYQ